MQKVNHGYAGGGRINSRLRYPIVSVGVPVCRRPMMRLDLNGPVWLPKNDGLIIAGGTLIVLGLILSFAAAPHSLPIAIPILVVGLALVGLGIFFKNREEPKKPLTESNTASEKNKKNDDRQVEGAK